MATKTKKGRPKIDREREEIANRLADLHEALNCAYFFVDGFRRKIEEQELKLQALRGE